MIIRKNPVAFVMSDNSIRIIDRDQPDPEGVIGKILSPIESILTKTELYHIPAGSPLSVSGYTAFKVNGKVSIVHVDNNGAAPMGATMASRNIERSWNNTRSRSVVSKMRREVMGNGNVLLNNEFSAGLDVRIAISRGKRDRGAIKYWTLEVPASNDHWYLTVNSNDELGLHHRIEGNNICIVSQVILKDNLPNRDRVTIEVVGNVGPIFLDDIQMTVIAPGRYRADIPAGRSKYLTLSIPLLSTHNVKKVSIL